MNEFESHIPSAWVRRTAVILLIASLLSQLYLVLELFLVPIAWALVIAHVTWPLHLRLRRMVGNRPAVCAMLMVTGIGLIILCPLLWFILMLQENIADGYRMLNGYLSNATHLPDAILNIPWLGQELQNWINSHSVGTAGLNQQLMLWARQGASLIFGLFGDVGRNVAKLAFTSLTLFVLYRDGENLFRGVKAVLFSILGARFEEYLRIAGGMSKAVMFSVVLTAIVQGTIAGLGFWICGVPGAVMLGVLTAVCSILPVVGTFLVWGPAALWLLLNGHSWQALGMFAWGSLLIHPADNLIRPLVISNTTQVSFVLVMFGIFGGIAAFGLIGLFVGPVILAIGRVAWNEWVQSSSTIVVEEKSNPKI